MTSPRKDLDAIFIHTPAATASLGIRLSWLADLLNWILSDSALRGEDVYFNRGETQALRVKWALHLLERRPEWRQSVSTVLQSLPPDTQVFDLLVMTGLHQQAGLISEMIERLQSEILPRPKEDENLQFFFSNAFSSETDAQSFLRIDDETFQAMTQLFVQDGADVFHRWRQVTRRDVADAVHDARELGYSRLCDVFGDRTCDRRMGRAAWPVGTRGMARQGSRMGRCAAICWQGLCL